MRSHQLVSTARKMRRFIEQNAEQLTDAQALEIKTAFPLWHADTGYIAGDRVRYVEHLYKCLQSHTAQADWSPDRVPALWTRVAEPGEIPEWKQPTGSSDAYSYGDVVYYNGTKYASTADANVWRPGEYGWEVVS